MHRLPHRTLAQVFEVALELHQANAVDELRVRLPVLLNALIPCDRVSVDEVRLTADHFVITPSPRPAYWARLGDLWDQHWRDHPIWRCGTDSPVRRAVTFHEFRRDPFWRDSPLFNEYYRPVGVRDQMATFVHRQGTLRIGIGLSRSLRTFGEEERAAFDLIVPHIACAWRKAVHFESLQPASIAGPTTGARTARTGTALVTSTGHLQLTPREAEILGWIGEGKRNGEIAMILGVSPRTVEKHIEHILTKLGVETRGAAVRLALPPEGVDRA